MRKTATFKDEIYRHNFSHTMRITIKGTGIELSPEITDYVEKRLESILKFEDSSDPSSRCEVEVGRTTRHHQSGDIYYAEVNLHIPGENLRATAEAASLNAAIDAVKDEVQKELRQLKGRRMHFVRKQGARAKEFMRSVGTWGSEGFDWGVEQIRKFGKRGR